MTIGLKANADGSGAIQVGGSDAVTISTGLVVTMPAGVGGDFKMDSGYGSAATAYGCRAWVNFNGTGAVAIRDSGNVLSVNDNGTGDYTVVIDVDMPDVNYCPQVTVWNTADNGSSDAYSGVRAVVGQVKGVSGIAVGSVGVQTTATATEVSQGSRIDFSGVFVAIFR